MSYYSTSLLFISDGEGDANHKLRFGTYSTTESIKAGLDLEMPGASYIRGKLVSSALACRKLVDKDLDDCVREVLKLVKRVEPLGIPENAPETTVDSKETAQALRTVAANSIVLMKNEKNILPLKKDKTVSRALSAPF